MSSTTVGVASVPPAAGLTAGEVAERQRVGAVNVPIKGTSRTYTTILRTNVFSFYNTILFAIGVVLLALGRYTDAFTSVGLGLVNAVVGAVQEIGAKRKLDNLQLLDRADATVLRDGTQTAIPSIDVVRGDLLLLRAGDQIVVDGPVVSGRLEADESLLTGESDPIARETGDTLRSGSLCVAGQAWQRAAAVGADSYSGRLTVAARRVTTDRTPLQQQIDFVVRVTMALVALMSSAIVAQALLEGFTLLRVVQITAVLSGLVPYGLFFLIAVAYTRGAARIATQGALVQQVNAVESVTHVDVVCTDKTGTLTTGRLTLTEVEALRPDTDVNTALGRFAASVTSPNLTSAALACALPELPWRLRDEVPFASSTRWSGLVTEQHGTWVLGAPDALAPHLHDPVPGPAVAELAARGLRVLLLARPTDPGSGLRGDDGRPSLPELESVALIAFADELRPQVVETITRFRESGVAIKVLSGDDPRTVAALATQAGLDAGEPVAGLSLDDLDDAALDTLVSTTSVFGRMTPEQKERVVRSLRRLGDYVAMLGDGVNDARALKSAHVGVAMRSGSTVTQDVADIVLTDNSFGALLPARDEGRRIIDGLTVSMYVFLTRVATQGLVILTVTLLGLGFPYSPTQVGLTLLTVGIPTFFLTIWARPTQPDGNLLVNLGRFVVPASLVTAGVGTIIYTVLYTSIVNGFTSGTTPAEVIPEFESYTGLQYGRDADFAEASATIGAQTGLSTFIALASFVLILFLLPPYRIFSAWTRPVADKRPAVLVVLLAAGFAGIVFTPALSNYLGLTGAAAPVFAVVLPSLVGWFVLLSAVYHWRILDRVLRIDRLPSQSR